MLNVLFSFWKGQGGKHARKGNPLTFSETKEYIQHRINIASQKSGLKFPQAAAQVIYRYSKGIPRLINIACDRTLLHAFSIRRTESSAAVYN